MNTYGKETEDGTWRAEIVQEEDGRYTLSQYKKTPLGWEPMGHSKTFIDPRVAKMTLARLGYQPIA